MRNLHSIMPPRVPVTNQQLRNMYHHYKGRGYRRFRIGGEKMQMFDGTHIYAVNGEFCEYDHIIPAERVPENFINMITIEKG